MVTLITYPAGFGSASISPFCVKAMMLLNAVGQPWSREDTNDPRRMPRAKLPVLRTSAGLVPDSDNIRLYLEENGASFSRGLSERDLADSHAMKRMAEEHMYFLIVLDRWERESVWPVIRDTYFKEIPALLRKPITNGIRKAVLRGLAAQGLGRLSWQDRLDRLEQDLSVLTTRLSHSSFLLSDTPSLADMSVAPMLSAMRATPVETPISRRIAEDPILSPYIDRVEERLLAA